MGHGKDAHPGTITSHLLRDAISPLPRSFCYARFRHWRLYAEAGLARHQSVLWLYADTLTLEYANAPLSQYTVEYQPDKKHFRYVKEPRHFETPYQSLQQPLWKLDAVKWYPAQRLPEYAPPTSLV